MAVYIVSLNHHQADSNSHACAGILLRYVESGVYLSRYVKQYKQ